MRYNSPNHQKFEWVKVLHLTFFSVDNLANVVFVAVVRRAENTHFPSTNSLLYSQISEKRFLCRD